MLDVMPEGIFNLMMYTALFGAMLFGAVYIFLGKREDRLLINTLQARPSITPEEFSSAFPEGESREIADRVRAVLANNMGVLKDCIDHLDELGKDLKVELIMNPDLFWDIEEELGIKTNASTLSKHTKDMENVVTVEDLVNYVAELSVSVKANEAS